VGSEPLQQSASNSTSDYQQPPTMFGLHTTSAVPPSLRQVGSTARNTDARVRFGS